MSAFIRNCGLVGALVLGGCRGGAPNPHASTSATGGDADPALALEPAGVVVVVDPGVEPRRTLRYHLEEGSTGKSRMRSSIELAVRMGDHPLPTSETVTIADATTRVARVHEDERVRREWTLRAVAIEGGRPRATADPGLLVGTTGWELLDPHGTIVRSEYEMSAGATPEQRPLLDRFRINRQTLAIPLPEEPVGIGARWRARTRQTTHHVSTLDATYTLESLEGEVAVVSVRGALTAKRQDLVINGHSAHLVSLAGGVDGRMTIRLNGLEAAAELRLHERTELGLGHQGGRKMVLDARTRLQFWLVPSQP